MTSQKIKEGNIYKKIFNAINIPILIIDIKTGSIKYSNMVASRYYGYSNKDLLSMHVEDLSVLNKKEILDLIEETKVKNKIYTRTRHILSTGEIRDIEIYSSFFRIKDKEYIIAIINDIKEKVELEKDYVENKAHLDVLFENSPEAIAIVDKNFNIVDINNKFEKIFQHKISEVRNLDIAKVLYKGRVDDISINFREAINKGKYVSEEIKRFKKDGTSLDVLLMAFPLKIEGEISGAYCIYSDITETKKQEHLIESLTYKDSLTGLFNRDFFLENLRNEIIKKEDNKKNKEKLAILILNINEFKEISDALGHLVGDSLLKEFVVRLKLSVKGEYVIGRLSEDEFAIVVPILNQSSKIKSLTNLIIKNLNSVFNIGSNSFHITTNIGIATYPDDGDEFITLVRKAEIAMDRSKSISKNISTQFEKSFDRDVQDNYWIRRDLPKCVERNELFLNYQPIYNITTNKIQGVESLVRWNHKEKSVIKPLKFINLAEKTGFIHPIGEWVLEEACRQNKEWQDLGYEPIVVSVNVSVKQMENPYFPKIVKRVIEDTMLDPRYLQLEITETVLINDYGIIRQSIKEISNLGVKFSIDDFGTGYSSFEQLCELDISNIKIDKMFIDGVNNNSNKAKIVKAIISLARNLEMTLIAEGVENLDELYFLKDNECSLVQGYIFSKPVSSKKIQDVLNKIKS